MNIRATRVAFVVVVLACMARAAAAQPCQGTPDAPTNVVSTIDGSRVRLTWRHGGGCQASSFVVALGVTSDVYDLAAFTVSLPLHEWTSVRGTYYARVYGVGVNGRGVGSAETTITIPAPPTCIVVPVAPTSLAFTSDGGMASFTWVRGGNATSCAPTSYALALGSTPGARDLGVLTVSGATRLTAVLPIGAFYARVHAMSPNGISPASTQISGTIAVRPPCTGVPPGPVNLRAIYQGDLMAFEWDLPAYECGYTESRLQIGTAVGTTVQVITVRWPENRVVLARPRPGLYPPARYYLRAVAINDVGVSLPSNELIFDVP